MTLDVPLPALLGPYVPPPSSSPPNPHPPTHTQVDALPPELAQARVRFAEFKEVGAMRRRLNDVSFALKFCRQVGAAAGGGLLPAATWETGAWQSSQQSGTMLLAQNLLVPAAG